MIGGDIPDTPIAVGRIGAIGAACRLHSATASSAQESPENIDNSHFHLDVTPGRW
jgi:hypothetical protein